MESTVSVIPVVNREMEAYLEEIFLLLLGVLEGDRLEGVARDSSDSLELFKGDRGFLQPII